MKNYLMVLSVCLLAGCSVTPKMIRDLDIDLKKGQVKIVEHQCSSDPFAPCP